MSVETNGGALVHELGSKMLDGLKEILEIIHPDSDGRYRMTLIARDPKICDGSRDYVVTAEETSDDIVAVLRSQMSQPPVIRAQRT